MAQRLGRNALPPVPENLSTRFLGRQYSIIIELSSEMGRLIEFAPRPGLVRDLTSNAATGAWVDGDHVRFRKGFPEKIGGWQKVDEDVTFLGVCRALFAWSTLDGSSPLAVGTNLKYYVEIGGDIEDITPIRSTETLGVNPLTSFAVGSGVVTVTDAAHGAGEDDFVTISGATAFDGLTTGDLNKEHQIIEVVDGNSYRIDTGGSATVGSVAGGGAAVQVQYQINVGSASFSFGLGWGAGTWGRGFWGSPATVTVLTGNIRLWTQDNWGEDLLFCPRGGPIYRYDASSGGRGTAISVEGGASDVPTNALEILVAPNERIVFALGVNAISTSILDPLLVRWTDYEDYLNWTPTTTSASGGVRLSAGSQIITGLRANREILVWTDVALFGLSFVGGLDVYQSYLIDGNVDIIGPLAKAQYAGAVFWMGKSGFYVYDGRVRVLPCPVQDYVFRDINRDQAFKICAGSNSLFNELIFFYPSRNATENDRYVSFDPAEGTWSFGTMTRTAWYDRGLANYPRAAGTDGFVYFQEFGLDDGSTNPPTALPAFVESAPMEMGGDSDMGRGDRITFCNRLIPDVTFRASTAISPSLTYTFKLREYPGLAYNDDETATVVMGTTVDQYTRKRDLRLRARAMALRVSSEDVGVDWRLGVQRFEVRPDGRRS